MQRPTLIHTVQMFSVVRIRLHCGYIPAMGGKRIAMKARKKSAQLMVVVMVFRE